MSKKLISIRAKQLHALLCQINRFLIRKNIEIDFFCSNGFGSEIESNTSGLWKIMDFDLWITIISIFQCLLFLLPMCIRVRCSHGLNASCFLIDIFVLSVLEITFFHVLLEP